MKVGSLFSGIGGFDLGLERAGGFQTAWFCEQDAYCTKVLNKHWPDVPVYPDITELKGSDVEPVDVLCGGFPCQDLSVAGKGAGLAGARSGLWSEYARLIGELQPRYVVVENVSALLARGMGTVLGDLAALGYDAEWDCIPASAVGAPHQRDRVWIVAYPTAEREMADTGRERGEPWREAGHLACAATGSQRAREERQRDGDAADYRGADVADSYGVAGQTPSDSYGVAGQTPSALSRRSREVHESGTVERVVGRGGSLGNFWAVEPDVRGVVDELSNRVDGGIGNGNGSERLGNQEAGAASAPGVDRMRGVRDNGTVATPPPGLFTTGDDRGCLHPLSRTTRPAGRDANQAASEGVRDVRYDVHGIQPFTGEELLSAMSQRSWPPRGYEALGWWDIEPPVGRVAHDVPHRAGRLRSLGNALVPQIAEWIGARIMEHEAASVELAA